MSLTASASSNISQTFIFVIRKRAMIPANFCLETQAPMQVEYALGPEITSRQIYLAPQTEIEINAHTQQPATKRERYTFYVQLLIRIAEMGPSFMNTHCIILCTLQIIIEVICTSLDSEISGCCDIFNMSVLFVGEHRIRILCNNAFYYYWACLQINLHSV